MPEEIVAKTNEEGVVEALNDEIKNNEPSQESGAEVGGEEKTPEQIEEERIAAEEKAKKDAEDPEHDLGLDEDGKTPLKLKRSQILEFKKNNMLQADYTKKTQELAAEKANLKEVVNIIEHLKKNPKQAQQILDILETKEEVAKEEKIDLQKEITNIDNLLKDLPADDPYAMALRSSKAIIQETLKTNQELLSRLEKIENGQKTETENKQNQEAEQTLQGVLSSKEKALSFTDPEEAAHWKKLTLLHLVNNPKEYDGTSKEEFSVYFNKIADQIHADIVKFGEKAVNRYIKSKGGPGGVPVVGAGTVPAAPGKDPITQENLQGAIEKALEEEEGKAT